MRKKIICTVITSIIIILIFSSCNKLFPFEFSNANEVVSFSVHTNATPGVKIDSKKIIINPNIPNTVTGETEGTITIVVDSGNQYFPLVFNADITISDGAKILNWPEGLMLVFDNAITTKSFLVASASGLVKAWTIQISDHTPIPPDPNKKNANMVSFTFDKIQNVIDPIDMNIKEDSILLSYDASLSLIFPISFVPKIELPAGAHFADYQEGTNIILTDDKTVVPLTIIAADSQTSKTYYIVLKPQVYGVGSGDAEILDFQMKSIAPASISVPSNKKGIIDPINKTIYIVEYANYDFSNPIKILMQNLSISTGATAIGYNGSFVFNSFNDSKTITITAENGRQKSWKVQLLYSPQISNSGFENWSNQSNGPGATVPNLDGGQWTGNNFGPNTLVPSVVIVGENTVNPFKGTKSAQITTQYIYSSAAGNTTYTPVSGGNVFLGKFIFSNTKETLENPSINYTFGIPFTNAPTYVHIAIKYIPGSTPMINANLKSVGNLLGNAVPTFAPYIVASEAKDSCNIWVQVLDAGRNVIGSGKFATDKTIATWTEIYIPVVYTGNPANIAFLDIHCSSSKKGLQYIGASGLTDTHIANYPNNMPKSNTTGSILTIDDVLLIYTPSTITYPPMPE